MPNYADQRNERIRKEKTEIVPGTNITIFQLRKEVGSNALNDPSVKNDITTDLDGVIRSFSEKQIHDLLNKPNNDLLSR